MPRTLAQNAQYINETIKPAIKSAIEAQGVTVPSTDSFLDYADRIGEIEGGGSGYQLKDLPSGSISTVNDAAELPLNALKVSVDAQQDLHGYDHPWVGGAGKNKLPLVLADIKSANTSGTWSGDTYTVNGVSFEVNTDDGGNVTSVAVKGTPSATTTFSLYDKSNIAFPFQSTFYIANGCPSGGGQSTNYKFDGLYYTGGSVNTLFTDTGTEANRDYSPLSNADRFLVRIVIYRNATLPLIFYPMIRLETEASATFAPYSNICPISGWNSGEIAVCDDVQNPTQTETTTLNFPQTIYGAEWDVVGGEIKATSYLATLNGDEGFTLRDATASNPRRFLKTLSSMGFPSGASDNNVISDKFVNKLTVTVGDAFGTMRLTGDTLVFPDADSVFADATAFNQWLADNNTQICYKLATPTTIDLSPLSIRMLQDTNNLYADCGDIIDGEYFVDEGAIDVRRIRYDGGVDEETRIVQGRIVTNFKKMAGYQLVPLNEQLTGRVSVDWSKSFEIGIAFKFTSLANTQFLFADGGNNTYHNCPNLGYKSATQKLSVGGAYSSSSWAYDIDTTFTPIVDTWYFVKLTFDLPTLKIKYELTTDFATFTTIYETTLSQPLGYTADLLCFGGLARQQQYSTNDCLIDTFNTYVKNNSGSMIWGASTGAFPS